MKRSDLDRVISQEYTEESLGQKFSLRSYRLLEKGKKTLLAYPEIIDRHPQKKY
ncbi:Uncharacterised protein [Streptococcus pseudoporcinus]|uniref:Uncharacterized protein n=1 Tax=Streptococcus pseudoporcinus TaxID=361101 RepID=A0A4U9XNC4_9STRE|nr:Uncharacterised protein [Streptococcus pseudoporcinus]VUC66875.1 Uncharacterised protein [Streptococcus pseudoporcinus]VUC97803.1 Uncharacterised protein [Streptococcus pseudoporcinus]VUC98195.1 Uncharacterised protein [Streptococcus pseudoporcinus]